jgi:hypothetical protein
MRTAAWLPISLALGFLAASACGDRQEPLGIAHVLDAQASAPLHTEAASAPTAVPIFEQFDDVNPCSGLIHTVTFTGTAWVHEHNGRFIVRAQRTITTSSGFEGRGTDTFVGNGSVFKVTLNDMLTHPSGDRIRPHFVLVVDVSTETVRVLKGSLTCVGRPT